MPPADELVKCQDCGFLTCRPNGPGEDWPEVGESMRQDGDRPHPPPHTMEPVCFADAHNLPMEYSGTGEPPPSFDAKKDAFLRVVKLGRVCLKFEEYQPGLSPQAHMDTIDEQREDRKRINREKAELKLKLASDAAKLEEDRRQFDAKMAYEKWKHVATIVVALIAFAATVCGAYLTGRATVEAAEKKVARDTE